MIKLNIFNEQIPWNSARSKYEDMEIDRSAQQMPAAISFIRSLIKKEYSDDKEVIDSFTWLSQIKNGPTKETYEDIPYLVPFPVKGSKKAVIVVPGGGFSYLSSDSDPEGMQGEGDLVAKALNDAGISAFVLWYRTNPYRQPAPLADMQRAVRYLRHNSDTYGFDKDKIGAIGFSAGGFVIAGLLNLIEGKNVFPAGYEADEVDNESDELNFAALVYPALRYENNYPMLFASFSAEEVRNEARRAELMADYNCLTHLRQRKLPYFICYGTDDHMVSVEDIEALIGELKKAGQDVAAVPVEGADHGFGVNPEAMKAYGYWLESYLAWCGRL